MTSLGQAVRVERDGPVTTVLLCRPERRNAVDGAMDMILTGRAVDAAEAERIGLVNRVVAPGRSLSAAQQLAAELARFPQVCMREDRLSLLEQDGLDERAAIANELAHGRRSLAEARAGLERFRAGEGRHGAFR